MGQNGRPSGMDQIKAPGDIWQRYAPLGSSEGLPSWINPETPPAVALEDLKDEVDANKNRDVPPPIEVKDKDKDRLKIRTQTEIFGTEEIQRWYIDNVRESIEKMDGDRLYDFIRAHRSYGKSSFTSWNAEFAQLMNLNVPENCRGDDQNHTNRRITAAAQHVLVDFYNTDVFQLTYTKERINPWIFIDGKLGPYTVSVLSDYWMVRHGKESKKSPKPPGNAALAAGYQDKEKSHALYQDALLYLEGQTKKASPDTERNKEGGDSADQLAEKIKARYARFDQAGDSLRMQDLEIPSYYFDVDVPNISQALGIAYGENPKDPIKSPRLFRVLHLLVNQVGAKIEDMDIKKGETLGITGEGMFTISDASGNKRYNIQL